MGDSIGQAQLLDPEDGARVHQIESSWDVPGEVGAHSVACLEAIAEADAATTEKLAWEEGKQMLASILTIPEDKHLG